MLNIEVSRKDEYQKWLKVQTFGVDFQRKQKHFIGVRNLRFVKFESYCKPQEKHFLCEQIYTVLCLIVRAL